MTGTPSVTLAVIPVEVLGHLDRGDLDGASSALGLRLPDAFLEDAWLWTMRAEDLAADPSWAPWLVHAVVGPAGTVVGHAGYHGPPDPNGTVEAGYTIVPEHRGRGYAKAALGALIDLAAARGVRTLRATVAPDNLASLAVVTAHGLTHVGEQVDEVDGLELVYELALAT